MKEFRLGPWVGELGYWIMHVIPVVNGLRQLYPDAKITLASFEGDDAYLNCVHDDYVGYPYWIAKRGRAICEDIPDSIYKLAKEFDENYPIFNIAQPQFKKSIQEFPLRIHEHIKPPIPVEVEEMSVVFCPRVEEVVQQQHRNWTREQWNELAQKFIDDGYKVYVVGVNQDYYTANVVNIANLPDGERQFKTVEVVNKSFACIADCSGGQHMMQYMGCPSIVHGPAVHYNLYEPGNPSNRNYLETIVDFRATKMRDLTTEKRYQDCMEFIDKLRNSNEPRMKYERRVFDERK